MIHVAMTSSHQQQITVCLLHLHTPQTCLEIISLQVYIYVTEKENYMLISGVWTKDYGEVNIYCSHIKSNKQIGYIFSNISYYINIYCIFYNLGTSSGKQAIGQQFICQSAA